MIAPRNCPNRRPAVAVGDVRTEGSDADRPSRWAGSAELACDCQPSAAGVHENRCAVVWAARVKDWRSPVSAFETMARPSERAARLAPPEPGPVLCALGLAAIAVVLWCMADQMKEPTR